MRLCTGTAGASRRLGILLLFLHMGAGLQTTLSSHRPDPATSSTNFSSSSSSSKFSDLHIPRHSIFDDPWVQHNIAVAYAHEVQDGVGSQTVRMVTVYALAAATGIKHLFRPLGCVGHIGDHVHYRDAACNHTDRGEVRQLRKAQHMIQLPSTITEEEVALWEQNIVPTFEWDPFVQDVIAAASNKQPRLYVIERMSGIAKTHPDIFLTIPALRPSNPLALLSCRLPTHKNRSSGTTAAKPWLLDALRVAIHIRRGDVITGGWFRRVLNTTYYINLANTLSSVLEPMGCDYSIEIYIEAPTSTEGVMGLKMLRQQIPRAVLLVEKDMLWTWQMMATADILIMSNSMFSLSAGLMNPNAVVIHVPYKHLRSRVGMFKLRHWLTPQDETGGLPGEAIEVIKQRAGYQVKPQH